MQISMKAGCHLEPTGSDASSENGNVERMNGTFTSMVRPLLYSAGLQFNFGKMQLFMLFTQQIVTGKVP